MNKTKKPLRSSSWFGPRDKNGFMYRSWMKNQGISDARMSGTAFSTVVLHVAPEAMELGPLAAVQEGDEITLDAENGILQLEVSADEIARRLDLLAKTHILAGSGGYLELYLKHVLQADEGCDFDFLVGCRGADIPAHSH